MFASGTLDACGEVASIIEMPRNGNGQGTGQARSEIAT